mgnify:CR=1 FL=1
MTAAAEIEMDDFPDTIAESNILLSEWISAAAMIKDQLAEYDAGHNPFNRDLQWRWNARRAQNALACDISELKDHIAGLKKAQAAANEARQAQIKQEAQARREAQRAENAARDQEAIARKEAIKNDNMRRAVEERDASRKFLLDQLRAILTPEQMQPIYAELDAIQQRHRTE